MIVIGCFFLIMNIFSMMTVVAIIITEKGLITCLNLPEWARRGDTHAACCPETEHESSLWEWCVRQFPVRVSHGAPVHPAVAGCPPLQPPPEPPRWSQFVQTMIGFPCPAHICSLFKHRHILRSVNEGTQGQHISTIALSKLSVGVCPCLFRWWWGFHVLYGLVCQEMPKPQQTIL